MPVRIDEIKVFIDFHNFAILEFELLIGYSVEKLLKQKPSHGNLNEKFGKTASAIPIFYPEILMAKHNPNYDPFKEVKFISLFISPNLAYETERTPSQSLETKPCPSSNPNKNFCAMDMLLSTPCPYEEHNHPSLLISKLFRRMVVDAFIYHKHCKSRSSTVVLTLQLEH